MSKFSIGMQSAGTRSGQIEADAIFQRRVTAKQPDGFAVSGANSRSEHTTQNDVVPALCLWQVRRKRSERRLKCRPDHALVLMVNSGLSVEARVSDVSRSGMNLRTETALTVGDETHITLGYLIIEGTVKHCSERGENTFDAGIEIITVKEITAGLQWSNTRRPVLGIPQVKIHESNP